MSIKKIKLVTTLKRLKKANACGSGMSILLKSLPKNYPDNKPINLLHILKSNGEYHFFWAWRATTKKESKTKRMILHDIVQSVQHIYEEQYPDSSAIKNVLKALKTGKGLKEASDAANDAYYNAATEYASRSAYAAYAAASYDAADYASANYAFISDAAYAAYDYSSSSDASTYNDSCDAYYVEKDKQIKIIKKYLK